MVICRFGRFEGRENASGLFEVYIRGILVCTTDSEATLRMLCHAGYTYNVKGE